VRRAEDDYDAAGHDHEDGAQQNVRNKQIIVKMVSATRHKQHF